MMRPEETVVESGAERDAGPAGRGDGGADGVVPDVAHALRNHFHRLYYWIDLLGEQHGVDEEGREALDEALVAVRSIERLTQATMALSRSIEPTCITMTASELLACIAQSLRHHGATVTGVEPEAIAGSVQVDPGYMSQVIEAVSHRFGVVQDGDVPVEVHAQRDAADVVLVTIQADGTGGPAEDDVEARLEWALAERIAARHAGRLVWETAGGGARRALLLLPMAP